MPSKNFETYGYVTSDGLERGGFRTEEQAVKFALPKCCDNQGRQRQDEKDKNKFVSVTIVRKVESLEEESGLKRGYKQVPGTGTDVKTQYHTVSDKDGAISLVKTPPAPKEEPKK